MELQIISSEVRARKKSWPEVVLFGRSAAGEPAAICIPNARPYLLIKSDHTHDKILAVTQWLSLALNAKSRYRDHELSSFKQVGDKIGSFGVRRLVYLVQEPVLGREFYGYNPELSRFFRLELPDPALVFKARTLLLGLAGSRTGEPQWVSDQLLSDLFPEKKAELAACQLALRTKQYDTAPFAEFAFRCAEANLELGMATCDALGIQPGGWVTAPTKKIEGMYKRTTVRLEFEGSPKNLAKDGNGRIRVLSFDIEVITKDLGGGATQFYDGDHADAQLLCVSSAWYEHGVAGTHSTTFSLAPMETPDMILSAEDDAQHQIRSLWFTSEVDLLQAFGDHVQAVDPDVITGYNIDGFDIPWILKRSEKLGIEYPLQIGRLNKTKIVELKGDSQRIPFLCPGRVMMDLYGWVKKNRQLRQYNLDFVAEEFLKLKKMDVAYGEIGRMQETEEGRIKLAKYCELDARLVCELFRCKQLDVLNRELAVSLVCSVMLQDLNQKGTQNLLRGKLIGAAHAKGFVLPFEPALGDEELEDAEYEVLCSA